jgi:transposase
MSGFRRGIWPRFIVEVIETLDLLAMSGSYRGTGSASYHPALLLGILIYGYATGVFSSRKLERATYDSVAFRFIAEAADQADVPDGMSIPDELARREERLAKLAAARAKIEARAEERYEREKAEHEAKLAARKAKEKATGKKPGGKAIRRVKRWSSPSMALRWTAAAMHEAKKGFRRPKAFMQLPVL